MTEKQNCVMQKGGAYSSQLHEVILFVQSVLQTTAYQFLYCFTIKVSDRNMV